MVRSRNKRQKTYMLTPSRKVAAKAIAHKSFKKLADECLSDKRKGYYIVSKIGREIRTEMKNLCSKQSVLCSQSADHLRDFHYNNIYAKIKEKASCFFTFLMEATKTRTPRHNRIAVVCLCAMVVLKLRFKKINLLQKVVSLILYSGHCSKQVYVMRYIYTIARAYIIKEGLYVHRRRNPKCY